MRPERFEPDAIVGAAVPLVTQSRRVAFQDVDAAGTIFFPRALEYMSDAYLELLERAGLDVPGLLARRVAAAPVVRAEVEYLAPLRFGDAVTVEVVLARVGGSSTTFGHRVRNSGGTIAAIGQTVHVWVDGASGKPVPVPAELRDFLSGRPGVTSR